MSRWLVVGARGMLGQDLMVALSRAGHDAVGMDLPEVDITEPESVRRAMAEVTPDVVANTAAYTAVDAAEEHEDLALRVNGHGPGVLARAVAQTAHARLVHISTDYVFNGQAASPYPEDAQPDPQSAYGRTKLAGEVAVREALPQRSLIVRTAWLYGEHGRNFVRTMLTLERTRDFLDVVDDQRGQPTWSRDLAEQLVTLADSGAPGGTYHGTASGDTTWFGLTRAIFTLIGADPARVRPTTTANFPRPAPRPAFSVLGHQRWAEVGLAPMRDWREALGIAVPLLQAQLAQ